MLTPAEVKSEWEAAIADVQESNSAALKIKEELESRLTRALELQKFISNLENSEDFMSEDQVNEMSENLQDRKTKNTKSYKTVPRHKKKRNGE